MVDLKNNDALHFNIEVIFIVSEMIFQELLKIFI